MSDYRALMQALFEAHQNFQAEWRKWREGKLSHKEKLKLKGREPESVRLARDRFWKAFVQLFELKIYPLETTLRNVQTSAIDEAIAFLSLDIPAFRCGYAKENILKYLRRVPLPTEQKDRLKTAALEIIEAPHFRREFRRWCRLTIDLADRNFVEKLRVLTKSPNPFVATKAGWMLSAIMHHRKDLAEKLKSPEKSNA